MSDPWSRPPQQPNPSGPAAEPPTQQIPQRGQYPDPATQKFPEPPQPPTQAAPSAGATSYPPPAHVPPAAPGGGGEGPPPAKGPFLKRLFRDPLSILLVVVIVLALAAAGLVGAEIYARHRGNEVVGQATACVVQDGATASFGGVTPFLLQHLTKHYSSISIETAGNNIRDAKGMKAQIEIDDVQLQQTGSSNGTIGSLDATITWSADGIKQTIQNAIPLVGSFVTGAKTNKSDGTIELQMALGQIVVKPKVDNGGIGLDVEQLTGLGFTLPRETVQPALDAFAGQLTKNYPLGIKADSVEVTDDGVISKFSTKNATIPTGGQDPCFAGL